MINNCLAEQRHEVDDLKLRVAELQHQLNLAQLEIASGDEEAASSVASVVSRPTPLNPSFECKCSDSNTPFTFGFGGKFETSVLHRKSAEASCCPEILYFVLFKTAVMLQD
jgi:hypothetical protein